MMQVQLWDRQEKKIYEKMAIWRDCKIMQKTDKKKYKV